MTERALWNELRNELGVDRAHHAYEAALLAFELGADRRNSRDVDRGIHTSETPSP